MVNITVYIKIEPRVAMPAKSKRELIVSEALKLFYQNGFNATGIERIITIPVVGVLE